MKKRKPDSNSKSSAEVPEVLVLPPRTLLDKFGISFGDIDKFLDIQKSCNKGKAFIYFYYYSYSMHTFMLN